MRSHSSILIVAALGLTVLLSAGPPHEGSAHRRTVSATNRATDDAAFARLVRLAEPGADVWDGVRAPWGAVTSLNVIGIPPTGWPPGIDPPLFPLPPIDWPLPWPWPLPPSTSGGTSGSTDATTGSGTTDSGTADSGGTDGTVGPPPVGWPPGIPWPPPWWPPGGTDAGGSAGTSSGDAGSVGTDGAVPTDAGGVDAGSTASSSGNDTSTAGSTGADGTGSDGTVPTNTGSTDSGSTDAGATGDTGTTADPTSGGTTATLTTGGITGGVVTSGGDTGTTGDTSGGTAGTTGGTGPGMTQYYGGAWWFHFDPASLKHGENVSGTNVKIRPKMVLEWHDEDSGGRGIFPGIYVSEFALVFIDHGQSKVITLPVDKWFFEPAYGTPSASYDCSGAALQFASTNFPPGAIPVGVIAATTAINPYNLLYLPFCVTAAYPVAYNQGLTLSSNLESGDPQQNIPDHIYGQYPQYDSYEFSNFQTSSRAAYKGRDFLNQMNHSLVSSSDQLRSTTLKNDLGVATTFFAMTHGNPYGIVAYGAPPQWNPLAEYLRFDPDISSAVNRGPGIPGMNMVVMESCDTIPDMAGHPAGTITNAYKAFFGPKIISDTAYAGYGYEVRCKTDTDQGLDVHAADVYDYLQRGYTIQEALDVANGICPPLHQVPGSNGNPTYVKQLMSWSGDTFTRLMTVYTGKATPGYDPTLHTIPDAPTAWYKVLP